MKKYVFRPSRTVKGKSVKARLYVGRYRLKPDEPEFQVPLHTPDKEIATKRLNDIVLEKQREQEGIVAPKTIREAAASPLPNLIAEYQADLAGLGRARKHIHDTVTRIRRIVKECKWDRLAEVRADQFSRWRSKVQISAKTKKEYQISINAFLNWLVQCDRLMVNPLAKLESVETRGKKVREARAFTEAELLSLYKVAGKRLLAYQTLLYTGQRMSEVRALVWGDLHLDQDKPYALFREGTTKDKEKRSVPLHPQLASALKNARPEGVAPTKRVFWFQWPTYDILRADFKAAGIQHTDELGKVVHFHSFRKTWQTMGVRYGMNQRVAQEILGHSDPSLTANVYTDAAGMEKFEEISKFRWLGEEDEPKSTHSLIDSPKSGVSGKSLSLPDFLSQIANSLQSAGEEELRHLMSLYGASSAILKMAARAGVEPATK